MTKRPSVHRTVHALLLTAALAAANPLPASANEAHRFAVKATDGVQAIQTFALQSGLQILASADEINAARLHEVTGTLSTEEALKTLLKDTGLTHKYVGERTVALVKEPALESNRRAPQSFWSRFRFADAGTETDASAAAVESESSGSKERVALEEVIVSAQKREERLQDVPISISVLGGADLDRSTDRDLSEVLSRVPGVSVNELFLGGGSQIPIRGVAADLAVATGSSPTAYYLDAVPFGLVRSAYGPNPDTYDLERVEVLRGPQGTLYGASALNGVVRVLTKAPDLSNFELKARGLTSNTKEGSWSYRGDMAVNMPIVADKLAARVVLGYQDLGGWIDKPNADNVNDRERRNLRLRVKAQPTEQLSVGLSASLDRTDMDAPSLGTDSNQTRSTFDEPSSTDVDVYGLNVEYEFPSFSVVSTTGYLEYANAFTLDLSGVGTLYSLGIDSRTVSEEVVLRSTQPGFWRWTFGGIYRDSKDSTSGMVPGVFTAPGAWDDTSKSYAVFGELTRAFLDGRLDLTGGLRYFEDEITMREQSRSTGPVLPPSQLVNSQSTFDSLTPRLVLTWHPGTQQTVYASYSEGFRSGVLQAASVLAITFFPSAEPDTLKNYELGTKGRLLNGRLSYEGAIYYIDWQDVQQSIRVTDPVTNAGYAALVNGQSASGAGFEFSVMAQPTDELSLGVSFSRNDLTFDSDVLSGGVLLFAQGDRLNNSPEYTFGASADYGFPLGGSGLEGRLSASANYTSEQVYSTLVTALQNNVPVSTVVQGKGDSIWNGRVSFSVNSSDHWAATLFVDNINNEQGSPSRHQVNRFWDTRVRPRTIGAQLEYRY